MRDFNNIRILPLDYGPRTHPDGIESGPEKNRSVPYVDPPTHVAPSRLEQDLKLLQRRRFAQINDQKLNIQPYKTYFRDLMHEQRQRKKIEAALKQELEAKAIRAKLESENKPGENLGLVNNVTAERSDKIPTLADIRDLLSADPTVKISAEEKEIKIVKASVTKPVKSQKPDMSERKLNSNANKQIDLESKSSITSSNSIIEPNLRHLKTKGKSDANANRMRK